MVFHNNLKKRTLFLLAVVVFSLGLNVVLIPNDAQAIIPPPMQVVKGTAGVGAGTLPVSWSVPTTMGNTLIAVIYACDAAITPSFSLPLGWIEAIANPTSAGPCFQKTSIYYYPNAPSQTDITVGLTAPSAGAALILAEYSGLDPVSPFDVSGSTAGISGAPSTGTSAMTNQSSELIIGTIGQTVNTNIFSSPTNGFTLREWQDNLNPGADATNALVDKTVSSTGMFESSLTSVLGPYGGAIATFKAAGGGGNSPPSFTAGPADGGSYSGAPTLVGGQVTFTATATDPDLDNFYLAVCKTNAISAVNNNPPTCPGGSWGISPSTISGGSASVAYVTSGADAGNQTWYAFVCDHDAASACSASSQGSGNDGSPFYVSTIPSFSAGPSDGGSSAGTPTTAGNNVTFTATASDTEANNWYLAICKTNSVAVSSNAPPTCPGGSWAISTATVSGAQASVNYTTTGSDVGNQTWFGFACDHTATPLCSPVSQGSGNNGSPFVVTAAPGGGGGQGGGGSGTGTYGSIKVTVNTVGGDDTFNFTASGVSGSFSNFSITTKNGTGSMTQNNVQTGTYSATQNTPSGWTKTSDTCSTLIVNTNQTATCTVTNEKNKSKKGSITVEVSAKGGDSTFSFQTSGSGYKKFSVTTKNGTGSDTQLNLDPGTYSATETVPAGWVKMFDDCGSIVVTAGNNTTCTVKNELANPKPKVTSISPNAVLINSAKFTMTVNGTNFISSSVVRFNGSDRPTTFVSSAKLTVAIPASDIIKTGTFPITVFNPLPGGGNSNAVNFKVNPNNPLPTITSVSPNAKEINSTQFTMTVNGTNFISSSVVKFSGSNRATTYVSPTKLTAVIKDSDLKKLGTFKMTVANPTPGGGTSNTADFTVTPPPPSKLIVNVTTRGEDDIFPYKITGPTSTSIAQVSIVTMNGQGSYTMNDPKGGKYTVEQMANSSWQVVSASCITDNGSITGTAGGNMVSGVEVQDHETTNCTFVVQRIVSSGGGVGGGGGIDTAIGGGVGGGSGEGGSEGVTDGGSSSTTTGPSVIDGVKAVIAPVAEILTPVVVGFEVLKEQTAPVVNYAREVANKPLVSTAAKVVTTAGVAVAAAAVTSPSFRFSDIFLIPIRLWGLLLTWLGIRKKARPWGTVYDSVTKQPLDPAYVTLHTMDGKQVSSVITDIDGRYGLFVNDEGTYEVEAAKTNYVFPSRKVTGTRDEVYDNLYFGEPLDLTKGEVIAKNIPLDQVNFDWNEFAKRGKGFMKFYSRWDRFIRQIADPSFIVGFTVSILVLLLTPQPYNFIIFFCYVFVVLLRIIARALGIQPKAVGYITNKAGDPVSFALIKVMLPGSKTQIAQKVADQYGRYYCLVPKGKYYINIEQKNPDGSYSLVHTSPVIDAQKNGIIREKFEI